MKKNIFIKSLSLICAIFLFSGCVKEELTKVGDGELKKDNETIVKDSNKESGNQGITVNPIEYEVVDVETLSDQLKEEIETFKLNKGYEYWQQEDGSYLILISMGEKATGGYGIEVISMEDNEGRAIISVVETEPASGAMVIQVITYPYVVVQASGITDQFIIHDQSQIEYSRYTSEVIQSENSGNIGDTMLNIDENPIDFSKPILGIYKGQMDNHTIEVLVNGTYMPFVADNIDQYLSEINEGDTIEITISISPSDQWIVEEIVRIN